MKKTTIAILFLLFVALSAHAQTPLPADFFGFSISPTTLTTPANFPSVGFGSMRVSGFNSQWSHLNPSNGTYNFTDLDSWLALANAQGKEVVLGVYFTPAWASSNPTGSCTAGAGTCYPPSDIASGDNFWKAYITALVNHSLASTTAKVTYYEMWNEIDGAGFWQGTSAQMVTLATDATTIIHALDPTAKVLSPSVSSFNSNGTGQGWTALNNYFAAGGGSASAGDIVNIHSYPPGTPPPQPTELPAEITALQALMTSYGIGSQPIWFTEDGWNGSAKTGMNSDQQVAWVGQSRLYEWSGGVHTGNWFQWDNATFGTMWSSGGGVNTAGVAYGQLYNWLVGSTSASNPCTQDGTSLTWTCVLTLSNNGSAEILWNNNSTPTVTIPSNFTQYRTLDNATVNSIVNNQLTLGIKPLMVTAPPPVMSAQVTVSPSSVLFGNSTVATTSASQTITLTNTGNSVLTFSSNATLSGPTPGDFTVSPTSTCINGANVAAGATCTIVTTFTPSAIGSRSANVSISDNAPGSPHGATLSGTGLSPLNSPITINCPASANCKIVGQITISSGIPTLPASVSISPASGSVQINGTFPLVATVANDPSNLGVTWTVTGANCSGAACGTISPTSSASGATVTYTAPPTSPVGSIIITATTVTNQASFKSNVTVVTPNPPPAGPTGVNVFTPSCAHSGTTTTCSFTGYAGPTMIVNLTSVSTSSTVTGVQACKAGGACTSLTLVNSVDNSGSKETYQFSGINIGAGFSSVVVSASDSNLVNVAIFDTANIGALDTSATKTATATTNPTGPSLTTATANELVVCALGTSGTASAISAPFIFDLVGSKDGAAGAINATASAISPSWTTTSAAYAAVCGAYSVGTAPPVISVANNPTSVNVQSSATTQFRATVGNDAANQGVTWSATCGGGSCGTFSPTTTASGAATTFTAPSLVPSGSAVALVQHPRLLVQSNPATMPITASTAGTTLCVLDVWNTGAGTMTVTDSKGEAWGAAIDVVSQSGSTGSYDCLPNNVGGVGSITVTVAGSSPTAHEIYVREYSGLLASNIVDQIHHATGFVSPMDSGFTATTTNATDLLLGLGFNGASASFTAGNDGQGDNYGNLDQQTFIGSAVEDFFTTSATNTYKATLTPGTASGSGMFVAALKAGTGSGTGNSAITITATSVADPTKSSTSTVMLTAVPPPISVVVNPSSGTLTAGLGTISITPTVSNDSAAKGVTWILNGLGSLSLSSSASGTPTVYTPPAATSTSVSATITATSVSDTTKSAVASILVNPATQTGGGGTVACSPACPAFTGAGGTAQGSGAATTGGSGGTVMLVTNLNDSGSGSLRACLTATGARICVPRVSGVITALSRLQIFNPNLTVAGQTVPGGGLVIKEAAQCTNVSGSQCLNPTQCQTPSVGCGAPFTSTHDVVFRYLTYDGSAQTTTGPDFGTVGFETTSGNDFNIVYDHVSCYHWGNACIDIFSNGPDPSGTAKQTTVQWSLFYEPSELHPIIIKSDTTAGSALAGVNRDYHHNVAINYARRWGLFNSRSTRWVNNISYNGQNESGTEDFKFYAWGGLQADLIGNKYVDGPQSLSSAHAYLFQSNPCSSEDASNSCPSTNPGPPSLYMVNNIGPKCSATVTNSCQLRTLSTPTSGVNDASEQAQTFQGWEGAETPNGSIPIAPVPNSWYRATQLTAPTFPITVDPVTNLDAVLLGTVGNSQHLDCNGNFVSNRNAEDSRVILQYQNGTGGDNYLGPSYNGLTPPNQTASVPQGTVCPMTHVTGIFDGWLVKFGLPTNNPNLGTAIDPRSHYTIEDDFLNGIVPTAP